MISLEAIPYLLLHVIDIALIVFVQVYLKDKIKLQNAALAALLKVNRLGIVHLLNVAGETRISINSSDEKISLAIAEKLRVDKKFAAGIVELMKSAIEPKSFKNATESNPASASEIISAALQGVGMVTSAWMSTAQMQANAQVQSSQITASGKLIGVKWWVIGLIGLGVLAIGGTIIVIFASRRIKDKR